MTITKQCFLFEKPLILPPDNSNERWMRQSTLRFTSRFKRRAKSYTTTMFCLAWPASREGRFFDAYFEHGGTTGQHNVFVETTTTIDRARLHTIINHLHEKAHVNTCNEYAHTHTHTHEFSTTYFWQWCEKIRRKDLGIEKNLHKQNNKKINQ